MSTKESKYRLYKLNQLCYDCPHYDKLTYTLYIEHCTKCTVSKAIERNKKQGTER